VAHKKTPALDAAVAPPNLSHQDRDILTRSRSLSPEYASPKDAHEPVCTIQRGCLMDAGNAQSSALERLSQPHVYYRGHCMLRRGSLA